MNLQYESINILNIIDITVITMYENK